MDKISPQDDDVQSLLSDVTGSVENDTDTLGRQILQHQRDAQRINDLMQSHGQAFRKAKPINPRLALTLDNLERNDHVDDARYSTQGPREHRPPSIGSSNDSDPPLNVPREWGRKGKQNNGWMRRIHQDENAALRHTVSIAGHESSQVDWAAAADQPSGSVEQRTPPSQRRQQPSFTPPNNSLDRIRQWEADQDLTSASLLASTPALPSRNRSAIEEIRQREIHVIQQRGVASIRRQMYEQSTTETTRRRRSGDAPSEPTDGQAPTSAPAPKRLLRRSSVLSNKENIPTNSSGEGRNLPQVLHKSVESIGVIDQGNQATAQRDTTVQRPQQKRNDSMTLLRRLARVSSTSPSPTPTPAKENVDSEKEPLDGDVQADELRLAQGTPPLPERITDKYDGTDSQPRVLNQPNTSANTDSTPRPVGRLTTAPQAGEETQAQQINNTRLPHETPVVTGAWIDTPRANAGATTTDDIRAALKDLSADTLIPRPRSAPTLPSSALDAVLQDFRERSNETDEENALGDSTIASLEDILHPSSNDPTIVLDIPDAALLDASLADAWVDAHTDPIDTIPTTQAECDRRQELLAIESMNNHLRTARTTLKDTSRALRKVEHRVDAANNASPSKLRPATLHNETATAAAAEDDDTLPAQNVVQQHTHAHTPGICASCGRSTSVFKTLLCEYLSLFYRRDASSRAWGIRLTSLGMACAVFWIWFASESTACSLFCHKTYATSMRSYGVDPRAPRFPFVLPTLLFRPFEFLWRPIFAVLAWCFGVLVPSFSSTSSTTSFSSPSSGSASAAASYSGLDQSSIASRAAYSGQKAYSGPRYYPADAGIRGSDDHDDDYDGHVDDDARAADKAFLSTTAIATTTTTMTTLGKVSWFRRWSGGGSSSSGLGDASWDQKKKKKVGAIKESDGQWSEGYNAWEYGDVAGGHEDGDQGEWERMGDDEVV